MKKIVKPHKARKSSASTDMPSFARGKDQILKSPARLQRRKKNELDEFDDGKNTQSLIYYDSSIGKFTNANDEEVTPLNRVGDDPAQWTFVDSQNRRYAPIQTQVDSGEITQGEAPSTMDNFLSWSNRHYRNPILGAPARYADMVRNGQDPITGVASFVPGIGEAIDVGSAAVDALSGNYGSAIVGGMASILPFVPYNKARQLYNRWITNRSLKPAMEDIQIPENWVSNVPDNLSHHQTYVPSPQNNTVEYNPFSKKQVDLGIDPHAGLQQSAEIQPNDTGIDLVGEALDNTQIVRKDGSINFKALRHGINRLSELYPNASDPSRITNRRITETYSGNGNSAENISLNTIYQNLLQHSLRTARAAQRYPVPEGFTRQQFVQSALFHDIGKVLSNDMFHDRESVLMLRKLGTQNIDRDVYDAIRNHMDSDHMLDQSNLTRALHAVDVNQSMSPEIGFYMNPQLVYPFKYYPAVSYHGSDNIREEAKNINKIIVREGYPKIDINAPESEIRQQVQDLSERMNTWLQGIRMPRDRNLSNLQKQTAARIGPDYTDQDMLEIGATHTPLEYTGYGRNGFGPRERKVLGVNDLEYDAKYISNSPGTASTFGSDINDEHRETRVFKLRKPISEADGATEQVLSNAPIGIDTYIMGTNRDKSPMSVRGAVGREFLGQTGTGLSTAIGKEYPIKYRKLPRSFGTIQFDEIGNSVNENQKLINKLGGTFEIPVYINGDTFQAKDLKNINTVLKSISDVLKSGSKQLNSSFIETVSKGKSEKFKKLLKINPQYVLKNQESRKSLINEYLYHIYKSNYAPKYVVDQLPLSNEVQQVKFAVDKGVVPSYMLPNFLNQAMYVQKVPKSIKQVDVATLGYNFDKYDRKVYDLLEDIPIEEIQKFIMNAPGRDNKYTSREFTNLFGLSNGAFDRGKDSGIHIKKANRGKFTAAAKRAGMGVQAYARKILSAPKGKYSPTLRRRAAFAKAASKFKH